MGVVNAKKKKSIQGSLQTTFESLDKNPLFRDISNIRAILYACYALKKWARNKNINIPREILSLILLDMRKPVIFDFPYNKSTGFVDLNMEVRITVLGGGNGMILN